jgi:hypothetical protein
MEEFNNSFPDFLTAGTYATPLSNENLQEPITNAIQDPITMQNADPNTWIWFDHTNPSAYQFTGLERPELLSTDYAASVDFTSQANDIKRAILNFGEKIDQAVKEIDRKIDRFQEETWNKFDHLEKSIQQKRRQTRKGNDF